jgi:hypothetical protein
VEEEGEEERKHKKYIGVKRWLSVNVNWFVNVFAHKE